jgi:hemoglobin
MIEIDISDERYGESDNSFKAAGGEQGIRHLVDTFYGQMDTLPQARHIRDMHPNDLSESREKLFRFLCGWLGGPTLYQQKYGSINVPQAHHHLSIGRHERDAWLLCMQKAIDKQDYKKSFKDYLMRELAKPAQACRTF